MIPRPREMRPLILDVRHDWVPVLNFGAPSVQPHDQRELCNTEIAGIKTRKLVNGLAYQHLRMDMLAPPDRAGVSQYTPQVRGVAGKSLRQVMQLCTGQLTIEILPECKASEHFVVS